MTLGSTAIPPGYELLGPLGRGGMATVYRVRELHTGRELALKVTNEPLRDAHKAERFTREGQLMAALDHPGILKVHGTGVSDDGRGFLLCELVEGAQELLEVLQAAPLERRVGLIRDAARAVGAAHAKGITHRDLKPANILVDARGRVHVADFGLALSRDLERLTRTGAVVGTPSYMGPEQVAGQRALFGPHTDVWALGVILYEALTGRLPFEAEAFFALARKIARDEPSAPRSLDAGVPVDLEAVCLKALSKVPAERYADAEVFADELDRYLAGEAVSASQSSLRLGKRRKQALLLLAPPLAAVGALGFALFYEPPAADALLAQAAPAEPKPPVPVAEDVKRTPSELEIALSQAVVRVEGDYVDDEPREQELKEVEGLRGAGPPLAAEVRAGSALAFYSVGAIYWDGAGVAQDRNRGLLWFRRAARRGSNDAGVRLAKVLLDEPGGTLIDLQEALLWLAKAHEGGDAGATQKLAELHLDGKIPGADPARGWELLQEAAAAGQADAMHTLARRLWDRNAAGDRKSAVSVLQKLRLLKDSRGGDTLLGIALITGQGIDPDPEAGVELLEQLVKKHGPNRRALLALGEAHRGGYGVSANEVLAGRNFGLVWLELSNQKNPGVGDLVLGAYLLWEGLGVGTDRAEAKARVDRAVALEPTDAGLKTLARSLREGAPDWPSQVQVLRR